MEDEEDPDDDRALGALKEGLTGDVSMLAAEATRQAGSDDDTKGNTNE